MPFNVSGVFQRLFNWQNDRDAGIKILAQRMDQELDGMVAGINDMVAGNVDWRGPRKGVNGTVALPAYSFTDDPDTGVYRSAANQLAFGVGGQLAGEFLSDRTFNLPYKLTIAGADVFADLNTSITGLQTQIDTKASQNDMDAVPGQISAAIDAVVAAAPGTLDTLNELAAALGDDPNFATTIAGQIALKANTADLGSLATKNEVGTGDFNVLQSKTELGIGFETRIFASWPQYYDGAKWVDFGAKAATIQRIDDVETKANANETAIAALPGQYFADGQSYSSPSLSNGVWYENTTGKPILVSVRALGGNLTSDLQISSDGSTAHTSFPNTVIAGSNSWISAMVGPGEYYRTTNVNSWREYS